MGHQAAGCMLNRMTALSEYRCTPQPPNWGALACRSPGSVPKSALSEASAYPVDLGPEQCRQLARLPRCPRCPGPSSLDMARRDWRAWRRAITKRPLQPACSMICGQGLHVEDMWALPAAIPATPVTVDHPDHLLEFDFEVLKQGYVPPTLASKESRVERRKQAMKAANVVRMPEPERVEDKPSSANPPFRPLSLRRPAALLRAR